MKCKECEECEQLLKDGKAWRFVYCDNCGEVAGYREVIEPLRDDETVWYKCAEFWIASPLLLAAVGLVACIFAYAFSMWKWAIVG